MSGSIGIICNDTGRYSLFWVTFSQMRHPPNTRIEYGISSDRILGRNSVVRQALEHGAEWLLFLDDDHTIPPDLLMRLLSHDVGVVGGLYLQRQVPFVPIAYESKTDDERYIPLNLKEHGPDDLVEVAALGTGSMLIRAEILHKMIEPWFEHGRASEDLIFCDKIYELGLGPVYVDLGARIGHLSPSAVWPSHDGKEWQIGFTVADGYNLAVPFKYEVDVVDPANQGPRLKTG